MKAPHRRVKGVKVGAVKRKRLGVYKPTSWERGGVMVEFRRADGAEPDRLVFRVKYSHRARTVELSRLVDHVMELKPLRVRASEDELAARVLRAVEAQAGGFLPLFPALGGASVNIACGCGREVSGG